MRYKETVDRSTASQSLIASKSMRLIHEIRARKSFAFASILTESNSNRDRFREQKPKTDGVSMSEQSMKAQQEFSLNLFCRFRTSYVASQFKIFRGRRLQLLSLQSLHVRTAVAQKEYRSCSAQV